MLLTGVGGMWIVWHTNRSGKVQWQAVVCRGGDVDEGRPRIQRLMAVHGVARILCVKQHTPHTHHALAVLVVDTRRALELPAAGEKEGVCGVITN